MKTHLHLQAPSSQAPPSGSEWLQARPFSPPSAAPVAEVAPTPFAPAIQTKLTVGAASDPYEAEADHVADQVVQQLQILNTVAASPEPPPVQRKESLPDWFDDEDEELVQRQTLVQCDGILAGGIASNTLETSINQMRGGGQALDTTVRRQMEGAFGVDFSNVRIHTDSQANAMNQALYARAFTTGTDIFFRSGEYQPHQSAGQHLLAHELTHVVQQSGGTTMAQTMLLQPKLMVSAAPGGTVQRGIVKMLVNILGGVADQFLNPYIAKIPFVGPALAAIGSVDDAAGAAKGVIDSAAGAIKGAAGG